MHPAGTIFISSLTILGFFAVQANAAAPRVDASPGVMIEVQSPHKCIDNSGSRKRGTGLQGWKCNTRNLNQRFTLVWQDNRKQAAQIKSGLSDMCLTVQDGSPEPGARIVQESCSETGVPFWRIVGIRSGNWLQFRGGKNGRCLSLKQIGKRDSTLIQSRCDRHAKNQRFKFRN